MEEQNNQSQTPPLAPPPEQHIEHENKFRSKWPFLVIALLLLLLGAFGGYFLLNQTKTAPSPTPSPDQIACTQEAKVCPDGSYVGREGPNCEFAPCPTVAKETKEMKAFTSQKFKDLSFEGYMLMYPSDWSLSEQRDNSTSISTVTLSKDGYALKIFQAATGGAGCIYEGDMPEGPASDYRNNKYKDLTTSFATLRQTETPSGGKMAYNYCQKNQNENSFGQPTSVGHMSVTTGVANPDPEIITEIEKIVESIKTL